jgi:S1-C subfamily serine protease
MNEISTMGKKSRKGTIATFIALAIIAMFIVGYVVGGSLSSSTTTSTSNTIQEQDNNKSESSSVEEVHNITYYYNTTSLANLYDSVKDSVVVITGVISVYSFFGMQYSTVQGSGFVYDYNNKNVIITNYHVVDGANNITVTFSNGDAYPAAVIGSDAYSDLAVITILAPTDEFHPLEISSSSNLKVGDPVVAIGSPFGLGGTMTSGIISQLGRTIEDSVAGSFPIADIIQTSAPINSGNSGGPLLNYQGEVIGITTAIISNSNSLGFAIPSNTILREIGSLADTGSYNQHSWLGISGTDMSYGIAQAIGVNTTYGWLITQVTTGGAAYAAGLKGGNQQVRVMDQWVIIGGDIIISVDGTRIVDGDSMMSYLEENTTPHQIIQMTIVRNHQLLTIPVELGQRPVMNSGSS